MALAAKDARVLPRLCPRHDDRGMRTATRALPKQTAMYLNPFREMSIPQSAASRWGL
jgi:hypothetical protein